MRVIRALYIYVSRYVKIRGYLWKQKGVRQQKICETLY
jgi:hypothetical protein